MRSTGDPGQCRLLGQPDRVVGAGQAVQRDLHDRGRAAGRLSLGLRPPDQDDAVQGTADGRAWRAVRACHHAGREDPALRRRLHDRPLPDDHRPLVLLRRAERPIPDLGRDHAGAGLLDGCADAERQCRPVRRDAAGLRPHDRRVGGRRRPPRMPSPAIGSRSSWSRTATATSSSTCMRSIRMHPTTRRSRSATSSWPACRRGRPRSSATPCSTRPGSSSRPSRPGADCTRPRSRTTTRVVEDFFGRLDRMGLSDDTLVIMSSDHGEYLGDRSFFGNRHVGPSAAILHGGHPRADDVRLSQALPAAEADRARRSR